MGARKKDVVHIAFVEPRSISWLVQCSFRKGCTYNGGFDIRYKLTDDLLSTVTVVHVKVYDGNLSNAIIAIHGTSVSCTNSNIVEKAESMGSFQVIGTFHDASWTSVMSRRTHRTKSIPVIARNNLINCIAHTTSRA